MFLLAFQLMCLFLIPPSFIRIFFYKPDRAGGTEFAIEFGIPAFETFVAHVNLIFHAHKFGFPIRMIDTFAHGFVPFVVKVSTAVVKKEPFDEDYLKSKPRIVKM